MKKVFVILCAFLMPVMAFAQADNAALIAAGDEAYKAFDNEAALAKYQEVLANDSENFKAMWKAVRTQADVAKQKGGDGEKDAYLASVGMARKCVELYPDSAASHYVLALAVGRLALFEGGKRKIELSKEVEAESKKALEIDPTHDGAAHILARWNYTLSTLSWVMRAAAKVIYGGVPQGATLENSEKYFKQAIQYSPDKPVHHLELARTLIEMDREGEAKAELEKCISLPDDSWEDQERKAEAKKMLKDLD